MPLPYTVSDAEWFINHNNSERDSFIDFGITANDVLIGNISVERGPGKLRHTAELGYYISENYRGKG
jgi:RimJ/RimL family protein N-acetyltransferase